MAALTQAAPTTGARSPRPDDRGDGPARHRGAVPGDRPALLGHQRYQLASTAMVPIFGAVIFLIGSALCGTAQSMMQLIIYRVLQGAG